MSDANKLNIGPTLGQDSIKVNNDLFNVLGINKLNTDPIFDGISTTDDTLLEWVNKKKLKK